MRARGIHRGMVIVAGAWVISASCLAARGAASASLTKVLEQARPGALVTVIVRCADRTPVPHVIRLPSGRRRAAIRTALVKRLHERGGHQRAALQRWLRGRALRVDELWHINALVVTADAQVIASLAEHPLVAAMDWNAPMVLQPPPPAEVSTGSWNLSMINVEPVWRRGYRGGHVVIACLDTGADCSHVHLQQTWRGGDGDWFDAFGEYPAPDDPWGHGTQALGLIVGGDRAGVPIGVAPGARWIAARIFRGDGYTDVQTVHRAFQWALDPDGDPNTPDQPDIINNSWGFPDPEGTCQRLFEEDIRLLQAAGILLVFAAGNDGPSVSSDVSPAGYPGTLSVGAVNDEAAVALFSSRGPASCSGELFPKLVAPGVDVLTTDVTLGGVFPDSYAYVTGTSFAAAHVSGALALLAGAFPDADPNELVQSLYETADDLGPVGPDNDSGHGLLNVGRAYEWLMASRLTADLDDSGRIDLTDLRAFAQSWCRPDCAGDCRADLNRDGDVDLMDFNDLARQYGHVHEQSE